MVAAESYGVMALGFTAKPADFLREKTRLAGPSGAVSGPNMCSLYVCTQRRGTYPRAARGEGGLYYSLFLSRTLLEGSMDMGWQCFSHSPSTSLCFILFPVAGPVFQ